MSGLQNLQPNETRFRWRLAKYRGQVVSMYTRIALFSATALLVSGYLEHMAIAAPTGGTIVQGTGAITQNGATTTVTQSTPTLVINWQTYSTLPNETINYLQSSTSWIAINNVIGGQASILQGTINALGSVAIFNQAGIVNTGSINVGALIASTAKNWSYDGNKFSFDGTVNDGPILNSGNIVASNGGFAILAAPYVQNTGVVTANLGTVQLASATSYTLDLRGDGRITFTVDKAAVQQIAEDGKKIGVDNSGTLQARSGTVAITAQTAADIVKSVVNLAGVVDADQFAMGKDGGTVLVASNGDLNISGVISANGGVDGKGGTVNTWADGTNTFAAGSIIMARGGETAGDGGFIEVSGKNVIFRGMADASAPNGKAGVLVLDPVILTIANGAGADSSATIFEENIEALSVGGTDAVYEADSSIVMNNLADDILQGGSGSITLRTTGNESGVGTITFVDKGDTIATTTGDITVDANGSAAVVDIGNLKTGGGSINEGTYQFAFGQPGSISVTSNSGDISVHNMTVMGAIRGGTIEASIYVNGPHNVNVHGDALVALTNTGGDDGSNTDASITMRAGQNGAGNLTVDGLIGAYAFAANNGDGDNATAYAGAELRSDGGNVTLNALNAAGDYHVGGGAAASTVSMTDLTQGTIGQMTKTGIDIGGVPDTFALPATPPAVAIVAVARDTGEVNGPNVSGAHGAYAEAYLNVVAGNNEYGGNLTITGPTVVTADARVFGDGVFFGPEGNNGRILGDAEAWAGANLSATGNEQGGNVTIGDLGITGVAEVILTGDVNATEDSLDALGEFSGMIGSATAYAGGTITASGGTGNITVNGDTAVAAAAHVALQGGAFGESEVFGNITISEFGYSNGWTTAVDDDPAVGDSYADADLTVSASQNATFNGDLAVTADATSTMNDVLITEIFLDAEQGDNAGFVGFKDGIVGDSWARAELHVSASNDVVVTGSTEVTANALSQMHDFRITDVSVNASLDDAYGGASARFYGVKDLAVGESYADAYLDVSAGHDATFADVTVTADATSAAHDITIDNVDVYAFIGSGAYGGGARAAFTGFKGDDTVGDSYARARANLSVGHDIVVNGPMLVTATAASQANDLTIGDPFAESFPNIDVYAELQDTEDSNYDAKATFTGFETDTIGQSYAEANTNLSAGHDITLNGLTVGAEATSQANDVTISVVAVEGWSHDYTTATARFTGFDGDVTGGARAGAQGNLSAGNDVTVNDDTSVTATALSSVGNISMTDVEVEAHVTLNEGSSEPGAAEAQFTGIQWSTVGFTEAYVSLDVSAGHDVTMGGLNAAATATSHAGDISISDVFVYSSSDTSGAEFANASFAGFKGDVVGSSYAEVGEGVELSAGNDIVVDGLLNVAANATTEVGNVSMLVGAFTESGDIDFDRIGVESYNGFASFTGVECGNLVEGAYAYAELTANAGRDITLGNNEGGVIVTGIATVSVGDVSVLGTVLGSGSQDFNTTTASLVGFDDALLGDNVYAGVDANIEAGHDVTLPGGISVTADASVAVGAVAFAGAAGAWNDGYGSNVTADFIGVDDDLLNPVYVGAYAELNAHANEGSFTSGGVTVDANASITVQQLSVSDLVGSEGSPFGFFGGIGAVALSSDSYGGASASVIGVNGNVIRAYSEGGVEADAYLNITGLEGVTINGNVSVGAHALASVGDIGIDGAAFAVGYGGFNDYGGNASAYFTGIEGDVIDLYVGSNADAQINVGSGYGGALTVNGSVNVVSEATAQVVSIDIAGGALVLGDDFNGYGGPQAFFTGIGDDVLDVTASSEADGRLYASDGDISVTGDVAVNANTTAEVGAITIDVQALTLSSGYGGSLSRAIGIRDNVVEGGDSPAGGYGNFLYSSSGLQIRTNEGGDVFVGGNVNSNASTQLLVGDISVTGSALAGYGGAAFANGIMGSVIASGYGGQYGGYGGLHSDAWLDVSGRNVTIGGDAGGNATTLAQVGDMSVDGSAESYGGIIEELDQLLVSPFGTAEFVGYGYGGFVPAIQVTDVPDVPYYKGPGLVTTGPITAYVEAGIEAWGGSMTLGSFTNSANASLIVGDMTGVVSQTGNAWAIGFAYPLVATPIIGASAYGGAIAWQNLTVTGDASTVANAIGTVGDYDVTYEGDAIGVSSAYFEASAYAGAFMRLEAGGEFHDYPPKWEPPGTPGGNLVVDGTPSADATALLTAGANVNIGDELDEWAVAHLIVSAHDSYGGGGGLGHVTTGFNPRASMTTSTTSDVFEASQSEIDATPPEVPDDLSFGFLFEEPIGAASGYGGYGGVVVHWHEEACVQTVAGCGVSALASPFIPNPYPDPRYNGLEQRIVEALDTPTEGLITIVPAATLLGILPGGPGGEGVPCSIGKEGLIVGLGQATCTNVVNYPAANDLLK